MSTVKSLNWFALQKNEKLEMYRIVIRWIQGILQNQV